MDQVLAHLSALSPLSEELSEHIRKTWKVRQFKKKEFLVKSGQINNYFFFIKKGLVRSYYVKGGKEVTLWLLKENDFIASAESYATQTPGKENMQALENCSVAYGHFTELENTLKLFPEFERHARLVAQKYSRLWYTLLYGIRMQTAAERYQFLVDHFPDLLLRVPAKHLASWLSINEITLSKIKGGK